MSANTQLVKLIDDQASQFKAVHCGVNGIEFEREKEFALQILGGSDYLGKVAMNNPDSLRNAVTNIAAIGISLNPASKQAYLVPRKGGVCLDISYMGIMHIAQQSGAIRWGQAKIVRENDEFELQEVGKAPIHKYKPFDKKRGDVIGVYCVVKTDTEDFLVETMSIDEVFDIRDRSEAYKAYKKDKSKLCPWVTDELEMVRKTVTKRASKYWPHRERLAKAIHYLNTDGGEGLALVQNEPKNVTPATTDQQIAITDRLREMKKSFSDLGPFFLAKYKQSVETVADLTEEQAIAVLAFIQRKAA